MKKIKGLTIVELIVGILILAIISIAAFEFFRYCQRFIVESEIRLGAVNFVRETMEWHAWDTEIDDTGGWVDDRLLPTGGEFASGIRDDHGGTRQYNVQSGAGGDYKVIGVRVNWNY